MTEDYTDLNKQHDNIASNPLLTLLAMAEVERLVNQRRSRRAKPSSNPSKAQKYAAAKKERAARKAAQKARRRNLRAVASKKARDIKQAKARKRR